MILRSNIVFASTLVWAGLAGSAAAQPAPTEPVDPTPAPEAQAPTPAPDTEAPAPSPSGEVVAPAEPVETELPVYQRPDTSGLVVGLKVGGGFSQPFGDLGSSFVGELELGYVLPVLDRALQVFVSGQYSAPETEGRTTEPDPRLPGDGVMTYDVTQRQAIVTAGLLYRLPLATNLFRPYAALGGRLYLMETEVTGTGGGEPFGQNDETATEPGFYAALGGDLFVGPGALLLELQLGYSPLDGFIMRDTNTGALNLALGYRFFF